MTSASAARSGRPTAVYDSVRSVLARFRSSARAAFSEDTLSA